MSRRPGLPVSFLVGIFSAIILGMAWGLVYFSMPTSPPRVAVSSSAPAALSIPPPSNNDTPVIVPPAPSIAAQLPPDTDSSVSTQPDPLQASPPSVDKTLAPAAAIPKSPKVHPSGPHVPSAEAPAALPVPSVPAEDTPALRGVSPACIVELQKLCESTQPGEARRKCFKDNETKLSLGCQRQMNEMAARIKEDMQRFRTACAGDVKQFCPDVHPGGGNVLQCLEENYKEVSENCYQALKHFQQKKAGRSL